jgi:ketosteroid isomerase-like protein
MTQPSRALLIAAGLLTQLLGVVCLVLSLASLPVAHDLKTGMSGVIASVFASLAAIVCGTLVWRGRLVPLALAAGLDVGFGIGLPRGGSAIGSMLRILPASDVATAETLIMVAAVLMFIAAVLCVISVPSAMKLRQWARNEIASPSQDWQRELDEPEVRRSGQTLRGLGPAKLVPTQVLHIGDRSGKRRAAIIIGVAVTCIALGVILISAGMSGSKEKEEVLAKVVEDKGSGGGAAKGSAAVVEEIADAGELAVSAADAMVEGPSFDEFVERFHQAIGKADSAELALLFDSKAFAFGVEAHDLAEGRDAVVAQLREDLGKPPFSVTSKYSNVAHDGDVAWLAEELRVGGKTFVVTAVAGIRDNAWVIGALHWAEAMPNAEAYKLAREGELAIPDAIPETHDETPLAAAMRTAFASKPSFVDARSVRPDAFNFGSASGERLKGGETIKKIFGRINAVIKLHDAVKVGQLGERGGWGAANVDFTDADKDGTEVTQTFRVLAAWVKEDAGWRIVQTQWSNAR